jgi:hypothetical protein
MRRLATVARTSLALIGLAVLRRALTRDRRPIRLRVMSPSVEAEDLGAQLGPGAVALDQAEQADEFVEFFRPIPSESEA